MNRQRSLRIAFSIGVSVLLLYLALRGIEWEETLAALAGAQYLYAIPIVAITVLQLYIRAQRWRVLLRPLGVPPMATLVAATNIGWMANFILPLRAGEIIRPVLLSRKENKPLGGVLATIALERVFDMFTILLLFGLTAALTPVSDEVQSWGFGLLTVAAVIAAGIAFVRWRAAFARRVLVALTRPIPERAAGALVRFFDGFLEALTVLDSPKAFLELVLWSLYLWTVVSFVFGLGILMFDIQVPMLLGQVVVTVVVAVAVSAPSAPGFIGAFQFGCVVAFGLLGVSKDQAMAYSFAIHATQFVAIIGAGLFSLAQQGMSLQQVGEVSESDDTVPGR